MPDPFDLLRRGGAWPGTKEEIMKRIAKLRDDLEVQHLTESQTAGIRGEIAGFRWLIQQVEPSAPLTGQAIDYSIVRAPDQQS